ncbi:DNA gyrase C-terminal beta-propeller domain-containing protein, partial [Acinetobacter baumannii]
NGGVTASFTVDDADQIMLVTNGGQVIRCPVDDIRVAGRNTQGVTLFKTAQSEEVVSVARLPEASTGGDDAAGDDGTEESNGPDGDEEA